MDTQINNDKNSEYLTSITSRLKKKRIIALKNAFAKGMQRSQDKSDKLNFVLNQSLEKAHELKINSVINCVQQLVDYYLKENPRAIISMAQKALKNISEHTDAELSAHPTDAAILAELSGSALRNITIIKEASLERGSLVIKANKSIIDAQISTQLNRARDVLLA